MLFQRPFLLHLSARRNVSLALWLRGVGREERAALTQQALRRVGLEDLAGRPARALSGGQQQRLAMARAWAMRPDILFRTHNLGQAKRLATRVAYLEGGHVMVDLPTNAFFHGPLPPEAAQFLRGELPWV